MATITDKQKIENEIKVFMVRFLDKDRRGNYSRSVTRQEFRSDAENAESLDDFRYKNAIASERVISMTLEFGRSSLLRVL